MMDTVRRRELAFLNLPLTLTKMYENTMNAMLHHYQEPLCTS